MGGGLKGLVRHLGRVHLWEPSSGHPIAFRVVVKDFRKAYGRVDALVTPEPGTGTGETWTPLDKLEKVEGEGHNG